MIRTRRRVLYAKNPKAARRRSAMTALVTRMELASFRISWTDGRPGPGQDRRIAGWSGGVIMRRAVGWAQVAALANLVCRASCAPRPLPAFTRAGPLPRMSRRPKRGPKEDL